MRKLVSGTCAALLMMGLLSGTSQAHYSTSFYWTKWVSDLTQPYRFVETYPTTASYRDRIRDARNQWNSQNQDLQWHEVSPDYANYPVAECPPYYQKNGIHWRDVSLLGAVWWCDTVSGNELHSVQMVIDSTPNYPWYTGILSPGLRYDLWSVASHEWGHMSGSLKGTATYGSDGQGHFLESTNDPAYENDCPDADPYGRDRQTLCPAIGPGHYGQRYIETHDIHTFTGAYSP